MLFKVINGTKYHYKIHHPEVARELVMIAGFGCNHTYFDSFINLLADDFKVLVFDHRGVGLTDETNPEETLTIKKMAEDTVSLIEEVGFHKPVLFGHSMGGNIATQIALDHPDKISKLLLFATTYKWPDPMLAQTERNIQIADGETQIPSDYNNFQDYLYAQIYGRFFNSTPDKIAEQKRRDNANPHQTSSKNLKRHLNVLKNFSISSEQLQTISVPTFIGYGQEDNLTWLHGPQNLEAWIHSAQAHCFSSGHDMMVECPLDVKTALLDFCGIENGCSNLLTNFK